MKLRYWQVYIRVRAYPPWRKKLETKKTEIMNRGSKLRQLFHRAPVYVIRLRGRTNSGFVDKEVRTY